MVEIAMQKPLAMQQRSQHYAQQMPAFSAAKFLLTAPK